MVIDFDIYRCSKCPHYDEDTGLCDRALKVFGVEVKMNEKSKCILFCDEAITEDI